MIAIVTVNVKVPALVLILITVGGIANSESGCYSKLNRLNLSMLPHVPIYIGVNINNIVYICVQKSCLLSVMYYSCCIEQ